MKTGILTKDRTLNEDRDSFLRQGFLLKAGFLNEDKDSD